MDGDPLVRGNAFFNLVKLGAAMVAYHENFYGLLEDGFNAGDSDRVVLRWDLASARAVDAADGRVDDPSADGGASSCSRTRTARPRRASPSGDVLLAWLPESIVALRAERSGARRRPGALQLRDSVGRALADGFRGESITRDGWLVLRR